MLAEEGEGRSLQKLSETCGEEDEEGDEDDEGEEGDGIDEGELSEEITTIGAGDLKEAGEEPIEDLK